MNKEKLWSEQQKDWRDPQDVISQWKFSQQLSSDLLDADVSDDFVSILDQLGITIFISREYEHLLIALCVVNGKLRTSYFHLPHPSGIAINRRKNEYYFASTRNPNQVFSFKTADNFLSRKDIPAETAPYQKTLIPISSQYYPGSLYLHDLAIIKNKLYGNAVGHNSIVELSSSGSWKNRWWPKCVERSKQPKFDRNYIQLNSIGAGTDLKSSFFSASSSRIGRISPGHLDFKVDKKGVLFSGQTREPIVTGLTRPHSARIYKKKIWVANSGYGQLGYVEDNTFHSVHNFDGWTRGLNFIGKHGLIGTSRVLPRFAHYAPGLDIKKATCGLHFFNYTTGKIDGSITWPLGNQIFAVDWIRRDKCIGFPFTEEQRSEASETSLFYNFNANKKRG